jgi:hypothetical protein
MLLFKLKLELAFEINKYVSVTMQGLLRKILNYTYLSTFILKPLNNVKAETVQNVPMLNQKLLLRKNMMSFPFAGFRLWPGLS